MLRKKIVHEKEKKNAANEVELKNFEKKKKQAYLAAHIAFRARILLWKYTRAYIVRLSIFADSTRIFYTAVFARGMRIVEYRVRNVFIRVGKILFAQRACQK